jgi:hypothetical protein
VSSSLGNDTTRKLFPPIVRDPWTFCVFPGRGRKVLKRNLLQPRLGKEEYVRGVMYIFFSLFIAGERVEPRDGASSSSITLTHSLAHTQERPSPELDSRLREMGAALRTVLLARHAHDICC